MRCRAGLLAQLERCGLAAALASQHDETSESAERSRLIRQEVTRCWHVEDRATIPEAEAALTWLRAEATTDVIAGQPLDLVDPDTGEVLVSGRPGAVLWTPNMVVKWCCGDPMGIGEPEDDLGLIAMGLAAFTGQPFQTCYVAFDGLQAFPRRSPVFEPSTHAGLFARIKAAANRPPVACPGDWCGACKQRWYCDAWKARAQVALMVLPKEFTTVEGGEIHLDLTNENSGEFATRLDVLKDVRECGYELLKAFVRAGGRAVKDGKVMVLGQSPGRETAKVAELKAAGLTQYIKTVDPFEVPRWKSIEGAAAPRKAKATAARLVKE